MNEIKKNEMKINFKPDLKSEPKPKKAKKPLKRTKRSSAYIKVYLNYFGFVHQGEVFCEICGGQNGGVQIHHIDCDGMGGTKRVSDIDNLMALCSNHHLEYGDKKKYIEFLERKHKDFINKFKT